MVRRAGAADLDVLAAIHAAAFPPPEAWSRTVLGLQMELPNVFALLHPAGGFILVRLAADEAEILTLAVMPTCRRQGIAGLLLRNATTLAREQGAASLLLEVSVTNVAAQLLYRTAGFVVAGRRRRYYSDGSDALVLRLDLPMPRVGLYAPE